jgi:hypothetical protein
MLVVKVSAGKNNLNLIVDTQHEELTIVRVCNTLRCSCSGRNLEATYLAATSAL